MRPTLIAALLLGSGWARAADPDLPVTFHIHDQMADVEIEEITTIYVDGRLVGSFHLSADRPDMTLTARVAQQDEHSYALCGHLALRAPGGEIVQRDFNVGGTLTDVADRDFEAVASDGFTRFYLQDLTPGRAPSDVTPRQDAGCSPATS